MEHFGIPLVMHSKVIELTLDHIEDCSYGISTDHLDWPVLWNIDELMS